jgi:hypothetical protein
MEAREIKAYLRIDSDFNVPDGPLTSKDEAITLVKDMSEKVMQEVLKNEEQIENLRQSHPDADNDKPLPPFVLSKQRKSHCIDFLEESSEDISNWIGAVDDNDRVKKILKIWFTLFQPYNQQPWCQFPAILNDDEFYPNAKVTLLTDAQHLGKFSLLTKYRSLHHEVLGQHRPERADSVQSGTSPPFSVRGRPI